jgi:hypothetical protein
MKTETLLGCDAVLFGRQLPTFGRISWLQIQGRRNDIEYFLHVSQNLLHHYEICLMLEDTSSMSYLNVK